MKKRRTSYTEEKKMTPIKIIDKKIVILSLFIFMAVSLSLLVNALPTGPSITYHSNSTAILFNASRSTDIKGTITVLSLNSVQQDYKWKAYVGNVTGKLTLDDSTSSTIYDWSLSAIAGEVYVSRAPSVTWTNISCANSTSIATEDGNLGVSAGVIDSINNTFNFTVHRSFLVGARNITNSSCKSIVTHVSDTRQSISESAKFQEVLLKDDLTNGLIYAALIDNDQTSYDGSSTYDFQLIVAENESASVPLTYYFYVELG